MSERKLGKEGRLARFKLWLQRLLRIKAMVSQARFTAVPRKARLSKRGEVHPSWYTKRWTRSRRKDLPKAMRNYQHG